MIILQLLLACLVLPCIGLALRDPGVLGETDQQQVLSRPPAAADDPDAGDHRQAVASSSDSSRGRDLLRAATGYVAFGDSYSAGIGTRLEEELTYLEMAVPCGHEEGRFAGCSTSVVRISTVFE